MNALHTQAMVQTLRYTGLRIGDMAVMARDRITRGPEPLADLPPLGKIRQASSSGPSLRG
jgi:hypothetical protein